MCEQSARLQTLTCHVCHAATNVSWLAGKVVCGCGFVLRQRLDLQCSKCGENFTVYEHPIPNCGAMSYHCHCGGRWVMAPVPFAPGKQVPL